MSVSRTETPWICRVRRPCGPLGGRRFAVRARRRVGRTSRDSGRELKTVPARGLSGRTRRRCAPGSSGREAPGVHRTAAWHRGWPGACIPAGSVGPGCGQIRPAPTGLPVGDRRVRAILRIVLWRWNRGVRRVVFLFGARWVPFNARYLGTIPMTGREIRRLDCRISRTDRPPVWWARPRQVPRGPREAADASAVWSPGRPMLEIGRKRRVGRTSRAVDGSNTARGRALERVPSALSLTDPVLGWQIPARPDQGHTGADRRSFGCQYFGSTHIHPGVWLRACPRALAPGLAGLGGARMAAGGRLAGAS